MSFIRLLPGRHGIRQAVKTQEQRRKLTSITNRKMDIAKAKIIQITSEAVLSMPARVNTMRTNKRTTTQLPSMEKMESAEKAEVEADAAAKEVAMLKADEDAAAGIAAASNGAAVLQAKLCMTIKTASTP